MLLSTASNKICNCDDALKLNNVHIEFSDAINICRNFAVLILIWNFIGRKTKCRWHSATTAAEPVLKSFINKRVKENSKELKSRERSGHASVAYKIIGKHLEFNKAKTVSSEADSPILLNMALNARKKHDLALENEHFILNVRRLTKRALNTIVME